jgi:hypothetical protein
MVSVAISPIPVLECPKTNLCPLRGKHGETLPGSSHPQIYAISSFTGDAQRYGLSHLLSFLQHKLHIPRSLQIVNDVYL